MFLRLLSLTYSYKCHTCTVIMPVLHILHEMLKVNVCHYHAARIIYLQNTGFTARALTHTDIHHKMGQQLNVIRYNYACVP